MPLLRSLLPTNSKLRWYSVFFAAAEIFDLYLAYLSEQEKPFRDVVWPKMTWWKASGFFALIALLLVIIGWDYGMISDSGMIIPMSILLALLLLWSIARVREYRNLPNNLFTRKEIRDLWRKGRWRP